MPLFIPNNPPSPFFNQQRRRILPTADNSLLNQGNSRANTMPGFSMATPMVPQVSHMPVPHQPPALSIQQSTHMTAPSRGRSPHMSASSAADQPLPSPEQAVQQFRRVNQGLPDGVRYEPLDENTMRLLRENGHLPSLPEQQPAAPPHHGLPMLPQISPPVLSPASMPSQLQPPVAAITGESAPAMSSTLVQQNIISVIENLIQDERNAHIFYGHLAADATSQVAASALGHIAKDCKRHAEQLSEVLIAKFGQGFTPIEAEINIGLELQSALELALEEENKALRTLAELLDAANNAEIEKITQRIINKKIMNYNQLVRFYTGVLA